MSRTTVSVVIPAFNCREWIGEAVDSALNQTVAAMEIIVVDDGSTDGTVEVLAGCGAKICVITQKNQGVSAARNAGVRVARGDLIAFLDGDDVWHPRKIELQVRAMEEHPEIGVLGTRVFRWPAIGSGVQDLTDDEPVRVTPVGFNQLAVKNLLTASSVMLRREVAERVGAFDGRMQGAEDYDYWLRAVEFTGAANLEAPLTGYRSVAGSLSKRPEGMEADMCRILAKLDERGWRGQNMLRRKAYAYCCYSCAYMYGAAGKQARGLMNLAKSLMWYPLLFGRTEVSKTLARPRMMVVLLLRLLRLMPEETIGYTGTKEPAKVEPCPACGSDSASRLHEREFRNRRWALARCGDCGQHFTSPTPTEADLRVFYAGDYHGELRQKGGSEAAFGGKYRRYAQTLSRHLQSGRVVDVGCSTGLLVRLLCDRGYQAEGVELNTQSAVWGGAHYGVRIHNDPLERCPFADGSLDAVLLTDVLEHTRHPAEFLRGVGRLLRPDGLVVVTFPDIRSLESLYQRVLAKLTGRDWLWRSCHIPLHVWEFTPKTAAACFEAAGFKVVEFRRSQPAMERESAGIVRLLDLPIRLLSWAGFGRWQGTQMEFVIQKVANPSENNTAGKPQTVIRVAPERARRVAA